MILLDTNVLSELMRAEPSLALIAWLDRQPAAGVFTAAICTFEVRMGLEALPEGRRRGSVIEAFDRVLRVELSGRVLPLDDAAAAAAARIGGPLRRMGSGIDLRDLLIAGTAAAHGARLATRNLPNFADIGIELVDPWMPM